MLALRRSVLAASAVLGLAAAPAGATVQTSVGPAGTLWLSGSPAADSVTLSAAADGVVRVADPAGAQPGAGCAADPTRPAELLCSGVTAVRVALGDGDDGLEASTLGVPIRLTDGAGASTYVLGAGEDVVTDSAGDDSYDAGPGDDRFNLANGAGADQINGGDGTDTASWAGARRPVTATLDDYSGDGFAGQDADVQGDIEVLLGGDRGDRLALGPAGGEIRGGAGDDTLTAGPAASDVRGGPGRDTIEADDGVIDRLDGGPGTDRGDVDALDVMRSVEAPVIDGQPWLTDPPGRVIGVRLLAGARRLADVPGPYRERVDSRLIPDLHYLISRYKVMVTAGYALTGHAYYGEHPIGLAVDLMPGPTGSWRLLAQLAHWAEPRQDHPRFPFRWVGWNGDSGHGDPQHCRVSRGCYAHLHLSWIHSPTQHGHLAKTVWVFTVRRK